MTQPWQICCRTPDLDVLNPCPVGSFAPDSARRYCRVLCYYSARLLGATDKRLPLLIVRIDFLFLLMNRHSRVAINGAAGRMGRQLLAAVAENGDCTLGAALEIDGNQAVGTPIQLLIPGSDSDSNAAGATGVVVDDVTGVVDDFDVCVDFTRPDGTLALISNLSGSGKSMVIGTTGFTAEQLATLESAATQHAIVFAPNYSVGVTLTLGLLKSAAASLGDDYDVEIIEAHHRNKVDAPSGTAIRMGEVVADALGRNLDECAIYGRQGVTDVRDTRTIGFETVRAGDIIGDHTVLFAGQGERIEITHRATDRMTFARGAVRAANWVHGQPPGLYDMTDVIGLR